MTTEKRPRGRPRGSGKDDLPHLKVVANSIIREPGLKPTTAMKRLIATRKDWGASDETVIRRWQVKWKAMQTSLLADAKESARPKAANPAPRYPGIPTSQYWSPDAFERLMAEHRRMQALMNQNPLWPTHAQLDAFSCVQAQVDAIHRAQVGAIQRFQVLDAFNQVQVQMNAFNLTQAQGDVLRRYENFCRLGHF